MQKPYYKNSQTGNYGIVSAESDFFGNKDYVALKTFVVRDMMIEETGPTEQVLKKDLIKVSREDIERSLLGF